MDILVIEDDTSIRENLQELLLANHYRVVAFADGKQGIEAAKMNPPDLILCDIMMPIMDGYEVLEALKGDENTANIPFIFVSAKVERKELRKGMELGADDYITKPFSAKELLGAIKTRLERQIHTQKTVDKALYSKISSFTKINSHEFNTPLNGIIGLSDVLIESADTLSAAEVVDLAKTIKISARRLHRTFTNFILYTQLEQGNRTAIKQEITDSWLAETLEYLAKDKAEKFQRIADLRFNKHVQRSFSSILAKDDLYYMLEELIWNALRFSTKNTPVSIELTSATHDWSMCISNLSSNSDFFNSVAPFKQIGRKNTEQQGSGLGLYICQELAKQYGWKLGHSYKKGTSSICLSVPI